MSDYRIEQGDCLELMKTIPDGSINMILTDLPYGTTACPWDEILPFDRLWENFNRVTKENGAILLFSTQPFTTKVIASNMKNFRYCWYWRKNSVTGGVFSHVQPMRCIEDICVFYKKKPTYNPQGLKLLESPVIRKKKGAINVMERTAEKFAPSLSEVILKIFWSLIGIRKASILLRSLYHF